MLADPDEDLVKQLDRGYAHGGGWRHFDGFELLGEEGSRSLHYPGDPAYHEIDSVVWPNGQTLIIFPYAWVCVLNSDETYQVCRMD